jgi:hypothetical protein
MSDRNTARALSILYRAAEEAALAASERGTHACPRPDPAVLAEVTALAPQLSDPENAWRISYENALAERRAAEARHQAFETALAGAPDEEAIVAALVAHDPIGLVIDERSAGEYREEARVIARELPHARNEHEAAAAALKALSAYFEEVPDTAPDWLLPLGTDLRRIALRRARRADDEDRRRGG